MRLSVIIVSYNVYPFLDNCLRSVQQSMKGINGEIIVVDNASVDRTPVLLHEHFPSVQVIANHDNKGFAKANNQAIHQSHGDFVLLLNPDTILSENTLAECLTFMDQHPNTGAIGVRMIDGSGRFLPESKRGFPTLRASFMKMTGLYKLFPRSAILNSYYQGHIGEHQTAEIEVLCGAFMFIRKSTLDKAGLLDEDFFMYGEDIDLSYRIKKTGHAIHYFPSTSIIHYKGESTRKSSLNYILTFYEAMLIFTRKHPEFKGQQSLINIAIYLHGIIQLIRQSAIKWWPPLLDAFLFAASFYMVSKLWANYRFERTDYFKPSFYNINIPLYTFITLLSLFLNGAYDKPYTKRSSWLGFGWGLLGILVIYAILPAYLRNSRMVILLGCSLYGVLLLLTRWKLHPWYTAYKESFQNENRKTVIVAGDIEANRIKELINRSRDHIEVIGTVSPGVSTIQHPLAIGSFPQLQEIVRVHNVREIIFSAQDVPFSEFTGTMTRLGPGLRYMLAASTTMSIVGSMSSETEGESYAIRIHFKLSHPASLRAKRIFDILSSMVLLILAPVFVFFAASVPDYIQNVWHVLSGSKTWVAYHPADVLQTSLPVLRRGIISPAYPEDASLLSRRLEHIHYVYARDYHWTTDLSIVSTQWKKIGQKPLAYGK